jgi:lipopolysaccharide transport system permease protein
MGSDLLASRQLAWQLFVRDLKAKYRQSLLGLTWAFFPPIITAIGLTLAKNAAIFTIESTDLPYPLYVIFSMALWQTFVESLQGPLQSLQQSRMMLAKINFPREALVLAKVVEVCFNLCVKLLLIIVLFTIFQTPFTWKIILVPLGLAHLIVLGMAIGMLIAPLGFLYQDFAKTLNYLTGFWLFLTPVVYPVPKSHEFFSYLVHWNPVTPLLVTTRELATTGIVSNEAGFWFVSLFALIGLFFAWLVYRLSMPFIVERMSA